MISEPIDERGERQNISGAAQKTQEDTPDDQRRMELMPEAEDAETEVDEDGALGDQSEGPHQMLHRDLHDGREVEVGVVGHDDAVEQDGHDAGEVEPLR